MCRYTIHFLYDNDSLELQVYFVFYYAGKEIEQPHEEEDVSYQADQPHDDQDVPYGADQPIENKMCPIKLINFRYGNNMCHIKLMNH